MKELIIYAVAVFTGYFAVMNPIANTPVFVGLVGDYDTKSKKEIARKGTLIAFLIVASFVITGKYLFEIFGISLAAFKITGGILLFYVGFEMLMSKKSSVQHNASQVVDESIAISPLAIPILGGPGTIVTAINDISDAGYNLIHISIELSVLALMCFLTYICFVFSDKIVSKLGPQFIEVIGKLMGLIIAVIGTTMIVAGIKIAFPMAV